MSTIQDFIRLKVAETLGINSEDVNPDEEFMSLGLDSMHAIFLLHEIEKEYDVEINPHSFWEHPTINSFSVNLEKQLAAKS
ncbi:MAG: acyl carrier protein [Bacteroidota bacterium]